MFIVLARSYKSSYIIDYIDLVPGIGVRRKVQVMAAAALGGAVTQSYIQVSQTYINNPTLYTGEPNIYKQPKAIYR